MSRAKGLRALLNCFICMVFVAPMLLSGCGGAGKARVYKVGVLLSLSGPAAPLGQPEQRSIDLLKADLDKAGGVNGGTVEFMIEDDESDPQKANLAVTRLIEQEGAIAVIGSSTTGATLAVAPTAERKQVPVVCMAAGSKLTQPPRRWLFSVAPSDALVIRRVLIYFRDELKVKNVAVLHDSNAYGTGGADEFKSRAPSSGVNVVASESYGSADTDMTAQLTKIAQTDAQAMLVWGTNPGPASIARNMQQLGITLPFVGSSGIANRKFIELAGPAANGVVFPASRIILPSTIPSGSDWARSVERFSAEYKKKYDVDIDTFAAHGWDAGNIVLNALKSAGDDSQEIRDVIERTTRYAGADGVFTYTSKDHAGLKLDALVMVKIENGQWVEDKHQARVGSVDFAAPLWLNFPL